MKKMNIVVFFMFMISSMIMPMSHNIKKNLEIQAAQLKRMLVNCNNVYIYNTTPMSKQSLTLQWYLEYMIPFRLLQAEHTYNAEILLKESKYLSDIIVAMESLQEADSCDLQLEHLINLLLDTNQAYMYNTPMYQQPLTLQWYLQYFFPFKLVQGQYSYNSEVLLTESKKLADITAAMIKFKKN